MTSHRNHEGDQIQELLAQGPALVSSSQRGGGGIVVYIRKPNEAMGAFSLPDVQNPETVEQGGLELCLRSPTSPFMSLGL